MAQQVRQFDRHIEAVTAALDVLNCFLESPRLSVKDIVELTGMTRNRVTRILGTLSHKGYVMGGAESGQFTPGPRLRSLGKVFEAIDNLVVLVRPALRELALRTGESTTFYIREGLERVVLAREEGTNAIRFSVSVGQRMELQTGAAGKVLLAYAPKVERGIIIAEALPKVRTLLEREIESVYEQGYSISKGERNPDAFAIAAPVLERSDRIIGAISLAGPLSRLSNVATEKEYIGQILLAATKLSSQLSSEFEV
ncbi:IclR family transcriptional regulator [Desulfopila sp. IMCC35008]|uniref:IclR family transcriptional regulator n=1 Tax=Desulfopila sp. IMCC35008 TaxID=2653858 RepID=UPI0013D2FB41|nr:IclR family transcriptional regulator [Desulfopila sp. IMCC35008]